VKAAEVMRYLGWMMESSIGSNRNTHMICIWIF